MVIDELPYWAEKDEALLSVLQKYIDTVWKDKNLKIILCGSALSFMENKVLSEKSPLFGRRDSQIKMEAFDYLDSAKYKVVKLILFSLSGFTDWFDTLSDDRLELITLKDIYK